MLRPLSYSPLYLSAFLLLLSSALTLADDPPQQSSSSDVTWLYPSLSVPSLTFNTLDTINVSWISHNTPAYLKLSCQTNNYYTTALELPVPATGNRLISLLSLQPSTPTTSITTTPSPPPYQSCTFQLSSPTNITNISQSVAFNLTSLPINHAPAFWSLDPTSFSAATQTFLDQKSRADDARCRDKNTSTSAMAAIGVGVAVGVFALTTAGFVLYEVQRRRKLQLAETETEAESEEGGGRRGTGKWIAKTLKGGGGGTTHTHTQREGDEKPSRPRPCGTMNDFSHIARSEIHPAERGPQIQEMCGGPVELESPSGGRYA
ncbi:MAG: hypothetical protein LQ339_001765 [Xanthoria mediterranea]|nr:MAG: hypothetical protein LQ339_001765 [Xanthoria mediterranea]